MLSRVRIGTWLPPQKKQSAFATKYSDCRDRDGKVGTIQTAYTLARHCDLTLVPSWRVFMQKLR